MGRQRRVSVSLGIIADNKNRVLLLWRPGDVHQGSTWSFPGGKIKRSETPVQALHREIYEETGLPIHHPVPLITLDHDYADQPVRLHAYLARTRPSSQLVPSGQLHRWTPLDQLNDKDMPMANRGILRALRLPPMVIISSAAQALKQPDYFAVLTDILRSGVRLMYLRGAGSSSKEYMTLSRRVQKICGRYQTTLMLDGRQQQARTMNCGLHLPAHMALHLTRRPIPASRLLSVACHNSVELRAAVRLQADFVYISPVCHTTSHPDRSPLGWKHFADLIRSLPIPAYALGGMTPAHLPAAWRNQGQGVALHSRVWASKQPRAVIHACLRRAGATGRPH